MEKMQYYHELKITFVTQVEKTYKILCTEGEEADYGYTLVGHATDESREFFRFMEMDGRAVALKISEILFVECRVKEVPQHEEEKI